jgi:glucose-6-phosphate dehydrogenase assembly protein OpcA
LHWTRLTGWRELLASLFDSGLRASDIRIARVGYGGHDMTTCARYFDTWLRKCLENVPVTSGAEPGPPGLNLVRLTTKSGDLTMRKAGENSFEVSGLGFHFRSPRPPATEEAVMREELGILGPDPGYERVLLA